MLKAVIFDMDGVIIDSEPMHARAAVLAAKQYNIDITIEYCYKFIGSTTYYMCQIMVDDFKLKVTPEELLKANEDMKQYLLKTEGYKVVPYIINLIQDLYENGMRLIIASSSPAKAIEEVMVSLNIKQYFEGYVSGMMVKNPKPAPDIFMEALRRLGLGPKECIVIEDSANGVNAAAAADIACIGFMNPNSGKQNLSKSSYLIEGFEEINYAYIMNIYGMVINEPKTIMTTERLVIRELTAEDIKVLYELSKDPDIEIFLDDFKDSPEIEIAKHKAYIKNVYQYYGYGLWGIFLKDTGQLIGRCGIEYKNIGDIGEYELGYMIGKQYQRCGYATECAREILSYFFIKYKVPYIVAVIDRENVPSNRLASRIGMTKENELKRHNRNCYRYIIKNHS
ncbi:GNAT family N-acetyltransferase [Mobilitalea sibirica]|uniref:GNAT family N-acetyltransferase n=1 Tax=Mobilitalea sibirica TaxID=1462919 RepID=A0A8J7KW93_9FIRM|nr:GNAT family N-acetyltransferase [Mobilitalea sibirica]MBH1940122.1 GNAT family N-acetyltransferase [Mobilitalea sibirica]